MSFGSVGLTHNDRRVRVSLAGAALSTEYHGAPAHGATLVVTDMDGWWEPAEDATETVTAPSGDGAIPLVARLGVRTIILTAFVIAAPREGSALDRVIEQLSRIRRTTFRVEEPEIGMSREADVRVLSVRPARKTREYAELTITLQADDPLRYGVHPPAGGIIIPNANGSSASLAWTALGSNTNTVRSYETGVDSPAPGVTTAVRRTYLAASTAEAYESPVSGTQIPVSPGNWLCAGAWMRRSDEQELRGLFAWRTSTGAWMAWSPFRVAFPGAYQWAWVGIAAVAPEGTIYGQPLFGSRITQVDPGAFFEVTGVVVGRSRRAPLPLGVN